MTSPIEVRMTGLGSVTAGEVTPDPKLIVTCSLCGQQAEVAVSIGGTAQTPIFGCPSCLRERLDAISVGRFRLREATAAGLPWGKVSG